MFYINLLRIIMFAKLMDYIFICYSLGSKLIEIVDKNKVYRI